MTRSLSRPAALLAPALLLFAAGCGSSTGTVTGKVAFKGEPVAGATVLFLVPDANGGKGGGKTATTGPDGSFTVDEVPVGTAKVSVNPPGTTMPRGMADKMKPPPGVNAPPGYAPPSAGIANFPAKFRDPEQSGLTVKIKGGRQEWNPPLDGP